MKKLSWYLYKAPFIAHLISIFVSLIIAIPLLSTQSALLILIISLIIGFIVGFVLAMIPYIGGRHWDASAPYSTLSKSERAWEMLYRENKQIKYRKTFLILLPELLCAVLYSIVLTFMYFISGKAFLSITDKTTTQFLGYSMGLTVLGVSAGLWGGYWITMELWFLKNRCKKCHCVMCYTLVGISNYKSRTSTQYKSRDTYGKIGELYVDDEKVGDVNGVTGSYTLKREVHTSSHTENYQCIYCGTPKKKKVKDTYVGNWKYE